MMSARHEDKFFNPTIIPPFFLYFFRATGWWLGYILLCLEIICATEFFPTSTLFWWHDNLWSKKDTINDKNKKINKVRDTFLSLIPNYFLHIINHQKEQSWQCWGRPSAWSLSMPTMRWSHYRDSQPLVITIGLANLIQAEW